jgi:hypothetical protein
MPSSNFYQPKCFEEGCPPLAFMNYKARGGHPFGLMQISKIAEFVLVNWKKILMHSF